MSVKFEKETIRTGAVQGGMPGMPGGMQGGMQNMMQNGMQGGMPGGRQGGMPGGRQGGDAGSKFAEGVVKQTKQTGYLALYLEQLQKNPMRTKMLTSGSLAALQELLASWLARDRSKHGHYFSSRVPKMAAYGAFISAPLGHLLIKILQKMFSGRTSLRAKILQILVSNLIVSPIQNVVYLTSMAVIAGARTFHQVRATIHAGFFPVMRVSWITSPFALAFAQMFLPEAMWLPFFNLVAFVIGTYVNTHTKKKRLAALRRKYDDGRRDDYPRPSY